MWFVDMLGNLICFELTSQAFQCIIPLNKVALEPEMEKHYLISGLYLTQTFIVSELRVKESKTQNPRRHRRCQTLKSIRC